MNFLWHCRIVNATGTHWWLVNIGSVATSHYLHQCWPRAMSPYGVTRPQLVNEMICFHFHWTKYYKYSIRFTDDLNEQELMVFAGMISFRFKFEWTKFALMKSNFKHTSASLQQPCPGLPETIKLSRHDKTFNCENIHNSIGIVRYKPVCFVIYCIVSLVTQCR